jgi:pilus assembly protein CpaE
MRETSIVLGIQERGLQEEVLHFLELLPGAKVVGAAEETEPLRRLARDLKPDVVVGAPGLLADLGPMPKLAVDLRETTDGLRAAIRASAYGYYVWPGERDALGRELEAVRGTDPDSGEDGLVVAILGARGGAGATFLATNLAAAFVRSGARTVLADLDTYFGDVGTALGIVPEPEIPSLMDLVTVSRELTPEHLDRVLHHHEDDFHVLLAPSSATDIGELSDEIVASILAGLRSAFAVSVLHLPRVMDATVRSAIEQADEVLVVVTLDVLGIRAAKRMIDHLGSVGLGGRLRLVVNQARRGEVVPEDAERVLGVPLACVIGTDRAVARAQNRGQLVIGTRGPISRRITRLAGGLLNGKAA